MNKHCPDWEEQLIQLADGELPAEQQPAIHAHLAACAGCHDLLQRLQVSWAIAVSTWQEADSVVSATVAQEEQASVVPSVAAVQTPTSWFRGEDRGIRQVVRRKTFAQRAAGYFAAVAFVVAACGLWFWGPLLNLERGQPMVLDNTGRAGSHEPDAGAAAMVKGEEQPATAAELASLAEIERSIQRQQHTAILRALNKMLEDTPGTEAVQASNREILAELSGG